MDDDTSTAGPPSDRVRLRRIAERGRYDAATITSILDDGLVARREGILRENRRANRAQSVESRGRCSMIQVAASPGPRTSVSTTRSATAA